MSKSWIFICLFGICCASTVGQTAPSAVQPPSAVHVLPPGTATTQSIMHLLEVTQAKRNMEMMFKNMQEAGKQGARQGFLKEVPDATEEQLKKVDSIWDEIFKDFDMNGLLNIVAGVYQRHLTQDDVNGLIAFYESPLGRKYLAEQPAMMQETMKASSEYASQRMEPMMQRMDAKMKDLMGSTSTDGAKSVAQPKNASPKKP